MRRRRGRGGCTKREERLALFSPPPLPHPTIPGSLNFSLTFFASPFFPHFTSITNLGSGGLVSTLEFQLDFWFVDWRQDGLRIC